MNHNFQKLAKLEADDETFSLIMTNSSRKVYFITGANRGIGLNLVKEFQHKGTVFATARSPEQAKELNALAKENSNIHIIKLDVTSKESTLIAAKEVANISQKVDVLIVNAGVSESYRHFHEFEEDDMDKHIKVNYYGAVFTFQAIYPLLKNSTYKEVAFISTTSAWIHGFLPVITGAYGPSKAALNQFIRQLQFEISKEGFITIAIHPGSVSTDMGNLSLENKKKYNVDLSKLVRITPEQSASDIAKILNSLNKSHDGKFLKYTGEELHW